MSLVILLPASCCFLVFGLGLLVLRQYPPDTRCFRHAIYGDNVGSRPHVRFMTLRGLIDGINGSAHRLLEGLVDVTLRPEERILILHPLVIAHSHATSIREDVRHYEHPGVRKDPIRSRGRWSVCELSNDLCLYVA